MKPRLGVLVLLSILALLAAACGRGGWPPEMQHLPDGAVPGHCTNGLRDADEADLDCGGPCAPCAAGAACRDDADCAPSRCAAGTCAERLVFVRSATVDTSLNVRSVAVADLDSDGSNDIVVGMEAAARTLVRTTDGEWDWGRRLDLFAGGRSGAFLVDLDHDGKDDLIALDTASVVVGRATPMGIVQAATRINEGGVDLAAGDFDASGIVDVVVATQATLNLHLGRGDGTFYGTLRNLWPIAPHEGAPRALRAGDFDGDGRPDLAVGTTSGVAVLLGGGDGAFTAGPALRPGNPLTERLLIADFNGDARPDVVALHASPKVVSLFLNEGGGRFAPPVAIDTTLLPRAAVGADLDGDGKLDLALVESGADEPAPPGRLSVLAGRGDGTFEPARSFPLDFTPNCIASGDLDGDGVPDLVAGGARRVIVATNRSR